MTVPKFYFKDITIGDRFDWITPGPSYNSFFKHCIKIAPRKYRDEDGHEYRVGSIYAEVCNIVRGVK